MLRFITKRVIVYTAFMLFVVPVLIFLVIGINSKNKNTENSITQTSSEVPLPSKESVIETFCTLIDEGRISEAVGMIDTKNDSEKQAWGVAFNGFSSFKLASIKRNSIDDTGNSFEVDIKVSLKKDPQDLPMPNSGWVEGINKKWINLVEYEKGKYKISEIATGP